MAAIEGAGRRIPKATYVTLSIDESENSEFGKVFVKSSFIQGIKLHSGDVAAVREVLEARRNSDSALADTDSPFWELIARYEGQPLPSALPAVSAFAEIPSSTLLDFGKALAIIRENQVSSLKSDMLEQHNALRDLQTRAADIGFLTAIEPLSLELVQATDRWNSVNIANKVFERTVHATPVGMLNLERIEMVPEGIQRGELIATIPLAPNEKTAVVQKEWSVTSREFTSIVSDSLESYSETGVTENTELAQATNSQNQHNSQFNISASISGTYGMVTASAATSFASQDSSSLSAQDSKKHAESVTKKASKRVTQEHKTTISTKTVTGTSEESTRILENKNPTDPIRIDYFSLMRKWRVRLFRYGLRMTYDIAIPEPGAAFRKLYAELARLKEEASKTFEFTGLELNDILPDKSKIDLLVKRFGIPLPLPPESKSPFIVLAPTPGLGADGAWHFFSAQLQVPEGYEIVEVRLTAKINTNRLADDDNNGNTRFIILGTDFQNNSKNADISNELIKASGKPFLAGYTGSPTINFFLHYSGIANVSFIVSIKPTAHSIDIWASAVWKECFDAAQNQYYIKQQTLSEKISALEDEINQVDTLTLRREESDEIMKSALRWMLGPSFAFMPPSVLKLFKVGDLTGTNFTDDGLGLDNTGWLTMHTHQEVIKFINEAVEWENVLYFPYSYFWDIPSSWDFIRRLKHPDKTRQAFLRAGSARVVLPIRKGYEEAWIAFVELGDSTKEPTGSPYLSIAKEIQAFANKNYPGIPPANPGASPIEPGNVVASSCEVLVSASAGKVSIPVNSSKDFGIGMRVIIDTYDSTVQEVRIVTSIPDISHVEVDRLEHPHDGSRNSFPLIVAGEAGLLIGEWHEYTPSSGVDIAVTSNLATIA
jgi:hypothetical protein